MESVPIPEMSKNRFWLAIPGTGYAQRFQETVLLAIPGTGSG